VLRDFADWLQSTPLSVGIQSVPWIIPVVQSIHILMIGLVFVSILMIALRVLGRMGTDQSLADVVARFAPWMWGGLAVMTLTGLMLVVGEPVREIMSLSFRLKMVLILVAVLSALAFSRAMARAAVIVGAGGAPTAEYSSAAKAAAIATVALWLAIIFLGRAIAYDVEVWGPLSLAPRV
jgi:hypothetical protein